MNGRQAKKIRKSCRIQSAEFTEQLTEEIGNLGFLGRLAFCAKIMFSKKGNENAA